MKNVSGIGIAYIPENGQKELYSIYVNMSSEKFFTQKIEEKYIYSDDNCKWYTSASNDVLTLSKPYTERLVNSISYAISKKINIKPPIDKNYKSAVIVGFISTKNIGEMLASLDFGSRGYAVFTDDESRFLLHPRNSMIYKSFRDIIKDKYASANINSMENAFTNKSSQIVEEDDFNSSSKKIIAINYVAKLNGFVGGIYNKDQLGFSFVEAKRILMRLSFYAALAITFLFIIMIFYKMIPENLGKRLIGYSLCLTIIYIFCIGYIWYLERTYGIPTPQQDKIYVSDNASLNRFLKEDIKGNGVLASKIVIPVGILVQSIKINGINEAEASGIVWQTIPAASIGVIKEGFRFPDATSTQLDEIYRTNDPSGNLIIGWTFKCMMRQNFDNKLYPFEQINMKIYLRQKSVLERVQFVPDLKSFDEYSSSSNSFMGRDVIIPGWIVKQTYFSIKKTEYFTTFGQADNAIKSNTSDLVLSITLQREFLSNFFGTFLSFIVLLLLAFIALLFSSGIEAKTKVFSFKASNMQGIASGFLLFLVFSIIGVRGKAISNDILYIEYLYFFTFFVLLTLVLTAVQISKQNKNFFGYADGLLVKTLYWPTITGVIYYITFLCFK